MRILTTIFFVMLLISGYATSVLAKVPPIDVDLPDYEDEEIDYQRTIAALKGKIEADPENYDYYNMLAFLYDCIGDYENEFKALKSAVKYMPEDRQEKDVSYGNLARACLITKRVDEAKTWIDLADKINPNNIFNRWHSLVYHILKNKFKIAAKELKRLDELNTTDRDHYYEAYIFYLQEIGDMESVIELFREGVKAHPKSPLSHRALGIAIRNSSEKDCEKNMPEVMDELEKALELDPDYIPTYITIGDTYLFLAVCTKDNKYYKDALNWFNKAYEIEPDHAYLAYATGNLFHFMDEYDKAIEKFEFAREHGIENKLLIQFLALSYNNKAYEIYQSGENLEQGLELINKAIELMPDDGIILGTKAELLYKLGKYREARRYIKQAIELKPGHQEMEQDLVLIEEALDIRELNDVNKK